MHYFVLWNINLKKWRHFLFSIKKINFRSNAYKNGAKANFYYVIVKSTTSYQNTTGIISFHIKQFFFMFGWRCTKILFFNVQFLNEIKSLKIKLPFLYLMLEDFFLKKKFPNWIDILYCWLTNIFNK